MSMMMKVADDLVQPFQIEATSLRGRLVRLGPVVDTILTRHDYPEPVATLLGEAIAVAVLLAGALKYEGVFTLQTKGDGPVRLLVADVTSAGAVRGYAQYDAAQLAKAAGAKMMASVPRLLGAGHIAFTVDQGEHTERYQGIVELQGATLAECAHHYFRQSEQLQAGIKTAIGRDPASGAWRAGGIMLQRLRARGAGGWLAPCHGADELEHRGRAAGTGIAAARSPLPPLPRGWRPRLRRSGPGGRVPLLPGAHRAHPAPAAGGG
jgi:molecular chaperone Hsp33